MRNLLFFAIVAPLLAAVPVRAEGTQAPPAQKALSMSDANVAKYVARLRVTKGSWDYLKLTLRDTFKVWSQKGGAGANLILDPGYTEGDPPSAGLARTTPLVFYFGSTETPSRSTRSGSCGACDGVNTNYNCGSTCDYGSTFNPPWCQVRRPGFNAGDYPGINGYMRGSGMGGPGYFHEFGFYIAPTQSSGGGLCPTAIVYNDFTQQQVCTSGYSYDTGSGKAGACTSAGADVLGIATVYYNARIFIYPNFQQEYSTDGMGWAPPVRRGPYSGTAGRTGYAHTTYTNCAGNPQCVDCGDCQSCAVWICIKNGDKWRLANCSNTGPACTAQWTRSYYNYFRALPTSTAHDANAAYDAINGSYFRQGDDTAFYTNIYQTQIHSVDRASAFPNDCELERIYTGTMSGGQPYYITDNQKVANCVRPKMYYSLADSKWKQCDAFDTWNSDGTLNPANDDAKWLYPGHPDTGGYSSPGRCGRQPCTAGSCTVGANGGYAAGSWTSNLNDIFSPGGGWYMLRLNNYTLNPGTNRIDVSFTSPDIRVEVGAVVDANACAVWICYTANEKRFLGRLRGDALNLNASVFLYNIDDTSCNPTYQQSCTGFFQRKNNNKVDPDKFVADVQVTTLDIVPPSGDWLEIYTCDDLFLGITLCDILNLGFVRDMLITELENAVKDMIAPAIGDLVSSIPKLNSAFGDPLNLGTVLFDGGFYLAGDTTQYEFVPPSDGYTKRYPLYIKAGPTAGQNLVDIRAAVGFKPIAFRPMSNANWNKNLMEIDTNDPPLADSVFGIPTLYNADTSMCASNNYCNTAPNPDVEVHTGCSSTHGKTLDTDQAYDTDDYCQGTTGYATSGTYRNQKTGGTIAVSDAQVIPEHWEGPIAADKQPPAWCMTIGSQGAPRTLRTGATAANFASLYPQTTWLSFHSTLDTDPRTGATVTKNTIGNFDQMPANTVLRQNYNDGSKDPSAITYDFSAHLHQRFFAEFFQALIATGVACIEFAAQDTMGNDTMFKDFLRADRFATFMPEVSSLFPGWYAKIRFSPLVTPHFRTGLGSLTFTPRERTVDPTGGPLPISAQPYTLAGAFPDIRIEFLVEDPNTPGSEVSLMTTYWSPVVGVYAKAVRKCYKLDPLKNDPQCTSTFTNVRTVSGYYEIFADMNSPSLKSAFENVKDGFAAGTFTNPGIGNTRGSAAFVIEKSYCNFYPGKCNELGLLSAMPTLLNSMIQLFVVSRFSFYNLTVDFLYVGPDGPNDDGVGQGDYLGIYARLLGNLNVFGLLDTIALLAPNDMKPQAVIKDAQPESWYTVNEPEVEVGLRSAGLTIDSELSYTYRVDQGFWHTPVNDPKLKLDPLFEGEHTLEIRPFEDTEYGATTNIVPTVLKFRVDTVPPDAFILPSAKGYYDKGVDLKITDLQTPADRIKREFSWDGGNDDFVEFSGDSVPVRGLSDGRHTLRVRVTDLAGNRATMAKEVVVKDAGWGCGGLSCAVDHSGRLDVSALLVLLTMLGLGWRRLRRE